MKRQPNEGREKSTMTMSKQIHRISNVHTQRMRHRIDRIDGLVCSVRCINKAALKKILNLFWLLFRWDVPQSFFPCIPSVHWRTVFRLLLFFCCNHLFYNLVNMILMIDRVRSTVRIQFSQRRYEFLLGIFVFRNQQYPQKAATTTSKSLAQSVIPIT